MCRFGSGFLPDFILDFFGDPAVLLEQRSIRWMQSYFSLYLSHEVNQVPGYPSTRVFLTVRTLFERIKVNNVLKNRAYGHLRF